MLRTALLAGTLFAALSFVAATGVFAEDCPGNPNALGVSRVMPVSAKEGPVGVVSYKKTLNLQDHEVVLTFDDGPIAHRTPAVLAALAKECVKATFFTVGTMAAAYPKLVQEEAAAGHTIGTHTWSHRYLTQRRNRYAAEFQIGGGLHAANTALGDQKGALSPFFRFPGLNHNKRLDGFVTSNGLMSVSVDIVADDWLMIGPNEVLKRTLARLESRGRGIILLHDIHNRTVQMLPELLRELKARNYKVVHMVADHSETEVALANLSEPQSRNFQLAMIRAKGKIAKFATLDPAPVTSSPAPVEPVMAVVPATNLAVTPEISVLETGRLSQATTVLPDNAKVTSRKAEYVQTGKFTALVSAPVQGRLVQVGLRGVR